MTSNTGNWRAVPVSPSASPSSSGAIDGRCGGYDVELFVDASAAAGFVCSICTDVMRDPVALPCGHELCQLCADSLFMPVQTNTNANANDSNSKGNPSSSQSQHSDDANNTNLNSKTNANASSPSAASSSSSAQQLQLQAAAVSSECVCPECREPCLRSEIVKSHSTRRRIEALQVRCSFSNRSHNNRAQGQAQGQVSRP